MVIDPARHRDRQDLPPVVSTDTVTRFRVKCIIDSIVEEEHGVGKAPHLAGNLYQLVRKRRQAGFGAEAGVQHQYALQQGSQHIVGGVHMLGRCRRRRLITSGRVGWLHWVDETHALTSAPRSSAPMLSRARHGAGDPDNRRYDRRPPILPPAGIWHPHPAPGRRGRQQNCISPHPEE